MSKERLYIFDTTLRDGAQTQGVDFSLEDKEKIALALDNLGVDYIEAGWPGANPTDTEFFQKKHDFKNSRLTSFGMTKRSGRSAENDTGLSALMNSNTSAVCLVGKSWDFHVDVALGITNEENLDNHENETQDEIKSIFIDASNAKSAEIVFADDFIYDNHDCDLKGNYQRKNMQTVLKASEILQQNDYKINDGHVINGLKKVSLNTGLKGRWEVIQNKPLIISDTAHNTAALKEVISQLLILDYSLLYFIIGFSDDKDLDKISKIFPEKAEYYFVKPKVVRGRDSQEVKQIFQSNNRFGTIQNSVNEALNNIKKSCSDNDVIFIGGSTFLISEIFR